MNIKEKIANLVNSYISSPQYNLDFEDILNYNMLQNMIPVAGGFETVVINNVDHATESLQYILNELCKKLNLNYIMNANMYILYSETDIVGSIKGKVVSGKTANFYYNISVQYKDEFVNLINTCPLLQKKPIIKRLSVDSSGYMDENEVLFSAPKINIPSGLMYPWCYDTPENIAQSFMNSNANVILLYGEPGTGKTTFIKKMLESIGFNKNRSMNVIDTPDAMGSSELISRIYNSQPNDVFIFEDVDKHLYSRKEGNDIMAGLLNSAEGLASPDVKMIISTNINRLSDVDSALIRPGRCFDTIEFKKLNSDQQNVIRNFIGVDVQVTQQTESLAEVMNAPVKNKPVQMGFA